MENKETIWSVPFVLLMAVNFFSGVAAYINNAIIPVYADHLGASAAVVGFVFGAFAMSAILIRPFAGPAFDSFSRKKLLVISLSLGVMANILYTFFASIPVLVFARLLQGITVGCMGPLTLSLVSETLPVGKLASGISIYTLSQTVAQVIGPAIGLWLMEAVGFSTTFGIGAGMAALALVSVLPLKEGERELLPYQLKLSRMFASEAVVCAIMMFLVAIPYAVMNSYIVLYGYMLGIENVAIFFIVYALCMVVTRPVFGKLADNIGMPKVIFISIIFYMIANALIWNMHDFAGMIIAAVASAAGFGAAYPLIQSLAISSAPIERSGAAGNTVYCGMDFAMLVGPSLAGIVIEFFLSSTGSELMAYSTIWLTMLIPLAIALFIVAVWARGRKA